MKKILLLIPIFLLAVNSFAQYGMHADNWPIVEEGVTMSPDTTIFNGGATSAKITSIKKKAAFRSGRFDVTAGAAFNFSIDVLDNTNDAKLRLYFYFRDECGNDIWSKSVYSSDSADWKTITINDTVPVGAVAADVKFKVYDNDAIPLYIDNATYTENGGANQFANSGFENWADLTSPSINCDQQVASDKNGSYIVASTNAATGKIYLVKEEVAAATQAGLEAAVTAGNGQSADITAANTDIEVLTTGLGLGRYFCYAADGDGNISEKSRNCIEITFAYDFLPQFWPIYEKGVTMSREKVIVKERTTSLKVETSKYKAAFRSGSFNVTPGEEYTFSIDVMDTTSDSKLRCYLYFRDNCGNDIEGSSQYSTTSTDWESIVFNDTVPEGAVTADVKFKVYDKKGNALFVDNASYIEGTGENVFPNPYFEFWGDIYTPWIRYDNELTVTNGPDVSVQYSTNASTGNVYIVPDTLAGYTAASLEALAAALKANKAPINTSLEQLEVATLQLTPGLYKLIIVDGYGSISDEFVSCLEIIEFDNTPPVVQAAAQNATVSSGQFVIAQSNETGWVYIIMSGEPATRSTELDAAVLANKGAKAVVGAAGTDVQILTENLIAGTYYAYAVDQQYNISVKGENEITITYAVGVKLLDELGMKVYPNPVTNTLNISQAQHIKRYEVINIIGRKVESAVNQNPLLQINTSGYAEGIYLLQIYLNDGTYAKIKFIKQ
ncbi:MAG: T9SS type A sorting domain-containing protein [Chlorobi bacterium]|nr:T9SS type A sorting domain-containing protein [Chlorobiota bacterium]